MRKGKQTNFMVMFRQPVDRFFVCKIPYYDVRIFSALPRCKKNSVIGNCEAGDLGVVSGQEMLVVRVLKVSDYQAAARNQNILFKAWVQED